MLHSVGGGKLHLSQLEFDSGPGRPLVLKSLSSTGRHETYILQRNPPWALCDRDSPAER